MPILTFWNGAKNPQGSEKETTWARFFAHNPAPTVIPAEALFDVVRLKKIKDQTFSWSPARFKNCYRDDDNVIELSALVLDFDNKRGAPFTTMDEALLVWEPYYRHSHSSFSNHLEHPKFRLVIPYSRPITVAEHDRIWQWASDRHAAVGQVCDASCKNAGRLWFKGFFDAAAYRSVTIEGVLCNPDAIISMLDEADALLINSSIDFSEPCEFSKRPIRSGSAGDSPYGLKALAAECETLSVAKSDGYSLLLKASFRIGQLVSGNELTESTAIHLLSQSIVSWEVDHQKYLKILCDTVRDGSRAPRSAPPKVQQQKPHPLADIAIDIAEVKAEWPLPLPLREHPIILPVFPDIYRGWVRDYVYAVSAAMQSPLDLAGMLALGVGAVALQRVVRVHVRDDHYEQESAFIIIEQESGSRKSPVFRQFAGPIESYERDLIARVKGHNNQAIADSKKSGDENKPELLPIPRLLTGDATNEGLVPVLEKHGRIAVLTDEGTGAINTMMGIYNNGRASVTTFLNGYDGMRISIDRKKDGYSATVYNPAITLVFTVQPVVVEQIKEKPELRRLGLMGRFWWSRPVSNIGYRKVRTQPIPDALRLRYEQGIERLLEIRSPEPDDPHSAHILELTPEADALLEEVFNYIEPSMRPGGPNSAFRDFGSKFQGSIARIAGILHSFENPSEPWTIAISADVMRRAIMLGEYLFAHAKDVLGDDVAPTLSDAEYLLKWLRSYLQDRITLRNMHRANRGRFPKIDDIVPALEILHDKGWIRVTQEKTGGRPSYLLHVTSHMANADKPIALAQELPTILEDHPGMAIDDDELPISSESNLRVTNQVELEALSIEDLSKMNQDELEALLAKNEEQEHGN